MVFKKQTTKEIVEQLLNEKLTEEDYALIKDIAEQEIPRFPTDEDLLSSVIAVDGIPVIDSSRKEKLIGILAKKFSCPEGSKVSNAAKFQVTKDSIEIPLDEEGNSKGFCFVDFGSPADAEKALRLLNGRHLDSKHIFRTFKLSSLDNYSKINDEFVPPPEPEFQETGDYQSWLLDKHCNDQFVMFHDRMTSVMWNTKTGAQPCIERDHWAEQYVAWSPKGSFLATVHQQGVALWGGEYWKKIQRFEHSGLENGS
jgi:translation initiation factor 3 subunit B